MRRRWYIVASLLSMAVAMLIAGPLLAQTTLPPVVVTAPLGRSAGGSLDLARESSAGSRLGLTLKEQPAAVEIVPGEVLRERGDLTAQEAVTRATGITAAGTPLDAFVTYKPTRFLSLTLRGHNVTDADYAIASYGSTQFILGQPRSVEFVANLRF